MKSSTTYRLEFEQLVVQAEQEINNNPEHYKRRLKYLAWLGYAVIFGMVFLLVSLAAGMVWAMLASSALMIFLLKTKLIFVLAGLIWVLGRSLFVRIKAPEGFELSQKDFPQLWSEIEKLRHFLKTAPIHRIILEPDMNAAIAQTPRLGMIGPYQNTLVLGLELLMVLSVEQARAVIAHELAHLSGNHSKFASWIYRVRMSWAHISYSLDQNHTWGTGLIRRFFYWYEPYFSGYSFVLARNNEYEADALAAQLTSREAAASALVTTYAYADLIQAKFWQAIYDSACNKAEPDDNIYHQLKDFFAKRHQYRAELALSLRNALKQQTQFADTHPALMKRLKALKANGLVADEQSPRALTWLQEKTEHILEHFNYQWVRDNNERWQAFHQKALAARQELQQLKQRDEASLSQEERWQMAEITHHYLPKDDALPLFVRYHKAYPDDPDGILALGRLLLQRDKQVGINYIEQAMAYPHLTLHAAEAAWQYYTRTHQAEQAEHWLRILETANDMMQEAHAERSTLQMDDVLLPANSLEDVDGHELEIELMGRIHQHKKVKAVWIAEKQVKHFPEQAVYVMGVEIGMGLTNLENLQQDLLNLLETDKVVFLVIKNSNKKLFKRITAVGKQLY